MIKIKDPFSYSARWDSVGLCCVYCKHSNKKNISQDWPTNKFMCNHFNISLNIEITTKGKSKGGIEGEWFCKYFSDEGAYPQAIIEFDSIKEQLEDNVLYQCVNNEYLVGVSFNDLQTIA